ncbi:MAG: MFS transporter [Oscillospiraceae bacterium]|nr:MFS transporter [Oscillospiraceae bacterium]
MSRNPYNKTLFAACMGYVVQAVVVNFAPLLFVTFQSQYGLSLSQISFLLTLTFAVQLFGDLILPKFIYAAGQRAAAVAANVAAALGLVLLVYLPEALPNAFAGILIAVGIYSLGSSMIEVLISPLVEACPFDKKSSTMSFLHSFYCWGSVLTVGLSTVYFVLVGVEHWKWLSLLWAIVPVVDGILFLKVPLASLPTDENGRQASLPSLIKQPVVWALLLLMTAGGAAELAVSQWASAFAEAALHVKKTVGDLLGPMLFAVLMGASRLFYALFSDKIRLFRFMLTCAVVCVVAFLLIALSPWPLVGLLACGLVGFCVGMFWPGSLSLGAGRLPFGGTALFSLMAAFGDVGCAIGPVTVGFAADALGGNLSYGMLCATIFPVLAGISILILRKPKPKK